MAKEVEHVCKSLKLQNNLWYFLVVILVSLNYSCHHNSESISPTFKYINPDYNSIQVKLTNDTLTFLLDGDVYNKIKSINYFIRGDIEYISFYDQRSETINFYNLETNKLVKKIMLKKLFSDEELYSTTVFVKNLDSLFIATHNRLYLLDSTGIVNKKFKFLDLDFRSRTSFDQTSIPVFKDGKIYTRARCYLNKGSKKDLMRWQTVYSFDTLSGRAELHYNLPLIYKSNLFSTNFFDYNFCYNNKNNFVFSFPADTNIYETNFLNYHMAYFAKSKGQKDPITSVSKDDIDKSEKGFRSYLLRDSYGAIYYDFFAKRYFRIAKSKITETDYNNKVWNKLQRLIIFDENFKIIGESEIDDAVLLNSIFITRKGDIYARTLAKDEDALHFVRLAYDDKNYYRQTILAKSKKN